MRQLQEASDAVREVEALLSSSLGPLGADKVLVTDANQVLISNAGIDMLNVLSPPDPLTSLLIKAVKVFHERHGDGSKRLLLLLAAGLKQALTEISHQPSAGCAPLVHALTKLQSQVVSDAAREVVTDLCVASPSLSTPEGGDVKSASGSYSAGNLRQDLLCVLTTSFANKVGSRAVKQLAKLLVDLVLHHLAAREDDVTGGEVIQDLAYDPPICLIPGSTVSNSRLLKGVIIHQGMASRHMPRTISPVKFVVIHGPLDLAFKSTGSNQAASLVVGSGSELEASSHGVESLIRERVRSLAMRGVNLIMCTGRCSPLAAFICLEAEVSLLPLVEPSEAKVACRAAGICAIRVPSPSILKTAPIGCASSCIEEMTAHQHRVVLTFYTDKACTLLLHSPSEGLGHQYVKLLSSGLALLSSSLTTRQKQTSVPALHSGHAQTAAPRSEPPPSCSAELAAASEPRVAPTPSSVVPEDPFNSIPSSSVSGVILSGVPSSVVPSPGVPSSSVSGVPLSGEPSSSDLGVSSSGAPSSLVSGVPSSSVSDVPSSTSWYGKEDLIPMIPGGATFDLRLSAFLDTTMHGVKQGQGIGGGHQSSLSGGPPNCQAGDAPPGCHKTGTPNCQTGDAPPGCHKTGTPNCQAGDAPPGCYKTGTKALPSAVLPALRVMMAMSMAVPNALLRTGLSKPQGPLNNVQVATSGSNSSALSSFVMVRELISRHQPGAPSSCASAPWLGNRCLDGLVAHHPCQSQTSSQAMMELGRPHEHQILEPAQLSLSLWDSAVSVLVQVLRIDQVVSVSSKGPNTGKEIASLMKSSKASVKARVRRGGYQWLLPESSDDDEVEGPSTKAHGSDEHSSSSDGSDF